MSDDSTRMPQRPSRQSGPEQPAQSPSSHPTTEPHAPNGMAHPLSRMGPSCVFDGLDVASRCDSRRRVACDLDVASLCDLDVASLCDLDVASLCDLRRRVAVRLRRRVAAAT